MRPRVPVREEAGAQYFKRLFCTQTASSEMKQEEQSGSAENFEGGLKEEKRSFSFSFFKSKKGRSTERLMKSSSFKGRKEGRKRERRLLKRRRIKKVLDFPILFHFLLPFLSVRIFPLPSLYHE